jgi:two-component system cell cycle response regulator DivK
MTNIQKKIRILYVEDDPVNMALVKKLLKREGFRLLAAENGWKGLAMAQTYKPDLILMDMNMPDLDGYEATARLKSMPELQHIPVVAVTANAMAGDRDRSLAAGCDGHITKPININTFSDEVRDYLQHANAPMPDVLDTGTGLPLYTDHFQ